MLLLATPLPGKRHIKGSCRAGTGLVWVTSILVKPYALLNDIRIADQAAQSTLVLFFVRNECLVNVNAFPATRVSLCCLPVGFCLKGSTA